MQFHNASNPLRGTDCTHLSVKLLIFLNSCLASFAMTNNYFETPNYYFSRNNMFGFNCQLLFGNFNHVGNRPVFG